MVNQQTDRFEKHIVISVGIHIALLLAFTVKAYVFPSDPIEIRSAIRIDVVGLPDKVETPKPKPVPPQPIPQPKPKPVVKTPPKPKPSPKPKPTVNLNKTKTAQQQAMERLKAMQALEAMKNEVAEQEKLQAQARQEDPEPTAEFKGNVITSGSSLTGLDRIDFEKYYDDMSSHVKGHWSLPGWLASANLRAEAAVTIDERGFVTSKRIYTSSGNQVFDDLVLQTVEMASPFPAPPSRLKSVLALKGMILAFPE
jgi:colicin import membrane protein